MPPLLKLVFDFITGDIFRLIWFLTPVYLFCVADILPQRLQRQLRLLNHNIGPLLFLTFPSAVLMPFEKPLADQLEGLSFGWISTWFVLQRVTYTAFLVGWGWLSIAYLVGKNLPSGWSFVARMVLALAAVPVWSFASYHGLWAFEESIWRTHHLQYTRELPNLPVELEHIFSTTNAGVGVPLESVEAPLFLVARSLSRVDDLNTGYGNLHLIYCDLDIGIEAVSQVQPLPVSNHYRKRQRLIDCGRKKDTNTVQSSNTAALQSGIALTEPVVTPREGEALLKAEKLLGEMLTLWGRELRPLLADLHDTTNDLFRALDAMPQPGWYENALIMLVPNPPGISSRLTPFGLGDWWHAWYMMTTSSKARVLRGKMMSLHRNLLLATTHLGRLLNMADSLDSIQAILLQLEAFRPVSPNAAAWQLIISVESACECFNTTKRKLRSSSEELAQAFASHDNEHSMATAAIGFLDGNGVYGFRVAAPAVGKGHDSLVVMEDAHESVAKQIIARAGGEMPEDDVELSKVMGRR